MTPFAAVNSRVILDQYDSNHQGHVEILETLETPVVGQYDVIVAGAGSAGVPAALAAARKGARTLLIEINSCLGGVWTAGILRR